MPDSFEPVPVAQPASSADRLDSWKEIASYLGREVRTVQGWEKNEALPIHRHQHARQGTVYAFKPELDDWRETRRGLPAAAPFEDEEPANDLAQDPQPKDKPDGQTRKIPARARLLAVAACVIAVLAAGIFLWKTRAESQETFSSIVVLPFLDLSPQKDQEYFSDGLTEELIDALSRVPNLHVVARTSAFSFKGKDSDIRKIGKQLNVGAVLEGSVRKSGDQLRITAQLCRVSDGYHFWSRTYDRQLADIFAVQREIAQAIAAQLRAGDVPVRETTRDLEDVSAQRARYWDLTISRGGQVIRTRIGG